MNKIKYIILLIFLISTTLSAQSLSYFTIDDLSEIKADYLSSSTFKEEVKVLISLAEKAGREIFTITKYESPIGSCVLHDYFSDSPYWWPVPGDSSAPFIRHDGQRNPNRFMKHKEELQNFYKTVTSLAFAYYFTNNKSYSVRASNLLKVWFVDEATRMNPNLKYAQMIQNRTRKRGVGILEGRRFALLIEAINLLKISDGIDSELYDEVKSWYSQYFDWLTESYYGIDEKERGNNHSTWYAMQVATIADYLQKDDMIKEMDIYTKEFLLDNQFDSNARQPMEEARTKSLSYSFFNITAYSYLNAVLLKHDINNWNYINRNGVKLVDAFDYLIPYLKNPSDWKLKQILNFDNSNPLFLAITGLKLNNKNYYKKYIDLSIYNEKRLLKQSFEPLQIIFDMVIKNKLKNDE